MKTISRQQKLKPLTIGDMIDMPIIAATTEDEDLSDYVHVGMIAGRHSIPVDEYVYVKDITDPTDFEWLEEEAEASLRPVICWMKHNNKDTILLYITGLTNALLVIQNICFKYRIYLDYAIYDRVSDRYIIYHGTKHVQQVSTYIRNKDGELIAC